jgi:hypothetical protein
MRKRPDFKTSWEACPQNLNLNLNLRARKYKYQILYLATMEYIVYAKILRDTTKATPHLTRNICGGVEAQRTLGLTNLVDVTFGKY